VRIGYYTGNAGAGSVDIGGRATAVAFQAGVHYLFVVAGTAPGGSGITSYGGTVCVTDVPAGLPLPASR
jgi:hypothetical protein